MRKSIDYSLRFSLTCALAVCLAAHPVSAAENGTPYNRPMVGNDSRTAPHGPWCGGYKLGNLTQQERLNGINLDRLRAAQMELAPGFAPETVKTGLYLLADYQEELEKRRPDAVLAANYLALASTVPITATRYRDVNALLCVSTTQSLAASIQKMAEAFRKQDNTALPPNEGSQP